MDFNLAPSWPSQDPSTPITVYPTAVTVRGNLITNYFQLLSHAGYNKILVSDSAGNGNWTDPSILSNNYWSNNFQDVHLNYPLYQKLGIGTSNPIDRFQVNDGTGKVSLGSVPDSLLSGTGYIGFNAAHHLSGWMFSGDRVNNGGGVIYSNTLGEMFFSAIGSTNGSDKILSDNDLMTSIKLSITPNGHIGMGTRTPTRSLEICHSDSAGGIVLNQISPNDTSKELNTTEIRFEKRGSEKYAMGYWKNANRPSFFIWNNMFQRTALFINEDNKVAINTEWPDPKADFFVNGNIESSAMGIGRTPPLSGSYKLYVEGGIAAREVKVTAVPFPDFVFEKNYNLLPINKLEEYISTEKHLPDLPSQSDIEKDQGVKIGELQLKLLQKIEEQLLYIISLQKQINELRAELETKKEK